MPNDGDLDLAGLDIPVEDLAELMEVDTAAFKADLEDGEAYLDKFGDKVPARLREQLKAQKARLG
jgi:phosphoenolpyruvate carboxykinase (GTP)